MYAKQLTRLAAPLVVVAVWCSAPPPCLAAAAPSPATQAAAQALYEQAVAAMDEHDYASACPKLEEVVRLIPEGIGAKLTLAECYENSDKLASAWTLYRLAEAGARNGKQTERAEEARKHAEALKPKLAQLTIQVPEEIRKVPGLAIERDGVPVGAVQWGVPLPVDQGEHRITATAPGKPGWEKMLIITANGANETVDVTSWNDKTLDGPRAAGGAAETAPAPSGASGQRWGTQRIAGLAVTGLGLVGIGVGTVFGLRAAGLKSDSNDGHCRPDDACDVQGVALRDDALSAGTLSTVFFITGGAAVAGGAVLFLTAPSTPSTPSSAIVIGPGGLALRGSF